MQPIVFTKMENFTKWKIQRECMEKICKTSKHIFITWCTILIADITSNSLVDKLKGLLTSLGRPAWDALACCIRMFMRLCWFLAVANTTVYMTTVEARLISSSEDPGTMYRRVSLIPYPPSTIFYSPFKQFLSVMLLLF